MTEECAVLRRFLLSILAATAIACEGPFVLLPGGELSGGVASPPADWSFAGDYGTAQLETKPDDPYSVNLAYTIVEGAVYINAGDTETQWVKNIGVDPRVRLRVDGVIYELRAERVVEPAEIERFAAAWTSQSVFRRDPTGLDPVWIYRLGAR
jgi:hypothetical protein